MSIVVDESAVKRITELRALKDNPKLNLRIIVEGGGCSGFQYKMELSNIVEDGDQVFADAVVTDDISLPFLEGTTISFEKGLIGSEFKLDNPNAKQGCGCGTSFRFKCAVYEDHVLEY